MSKRKPYEPQPTGENCACGAPLFRRSKSGSGPTWCRACAVRRRLKHYQEWQARGSDLAKAVAKLGSAET